MKERGKSKLLARNAPARLNDARRDVRGVEVPTLPSGAREEVAAVPDRYNTRLNQSIDSIAPSPASNAPRPAKSAVISVGCCFSNPSFALRRL